MISLITPKNDSIVKLLKEKHLNYIKSPESFPTAKVDWLNLMETQEDQSYPEAVRFAFEPSVDGEVVLTDTKGRSAVYPATAGEAFVTNLLIDEEYVWIVRTKNETSEEYRFRTDPQAPRMLYVDGISNVRDFGGFAAGEGKRIRQGMIYRTSEMDTHVQITEKGIDTLENELGIKTDIDIRGIKNEPRCPVLNEEKVRWVNYPLAAYVDCFTEEQMRLYGESYKLLTERNNYPIIIHCWGGIDRTGTWLYILGGMLGVSEQDLGLDYEMSSFSRWGRRSRVSDPFKDFLRGLYKYGDDLQAACEEFMRSCGLTDAELSVIRELLIEQKK